MDNLIFGIFKKIYEVGCNIRIFNLCNMWVFILALAIIWVLFTAFLAFVNRNSLR